MAHPQAKSNTETTHIGRPRVSIIIGGAEMSGNRDIHKAEKSPIKLKRVASDYGISTSMLAEKVLKDDGGHVSRSAISLTLNHGYIPGTITNYMGKIEAALREMNVPEAKIKIIWESENNVIPLGTRPAKNIKGQEFELLKEAEMLTHVAAKRYNLNSGMFIGNMRSANDFFMTETYRYNYQAMLDAINNKGFIAIVGESGSGKTTVRQKLIMDLRNDPDIRIIRPVIIDKKDMTASHILDAIINDLTPFQKPCRTKEAKARQVQKALIDGSSQGLKNVLMIEESHDIPDSVLRLLKRLWEIDDGVCKALGIVLVAQPELIGKLDIRTNPQLREVAQRCVKFTLNPLSRDELNGYIRFRFERFNANADEIFEDGFADEVLNRLTRNGQLFTYPLAIHNVLINAINASARIGAPFVSNDAIRAV